MKIKTHKKRTPQYFCVVISFIYHKLSRGEVVICVCVITLFLGL